MDRNFAASSIDRAAISEMFLPPTVTASEVGFSRAPWHVAHGISRMNSAYRSRATSLSASA